MMNGIVIDEDYIQCMGMEIVKGRNFSKDFPADANESVLINEKAVEVIAWEEPLGKKIGYTSDPNPKTVVGVVKDFHFSSPHRVIAPLFISTGTNRIRSFFVKVSPVDINGTLKFIENKWKTFDPGRPFEYSFLDESFDQQYKVEEKLMQIFTYFTFLAIFIACLGLFGLISFSAEQQTKEIGIRKVLGASVKNIVFLLSREFIKWVLIANIIAWPLSWFALNKWLQNFAYRIDMTFWPFLIAGIMVLIIAFITVSQQAIKAAIMNPVKSLRYE